MTLAMRKSFRPLRWQAKLLQYFVVPVFCVYPRTCRSRLAGDGGRVSAARLAGLIASKPAPTRSHSGHRMSACRRVSALCPFLMLLQVGLGQVAARRHAAGQPDIAADGGAATDGNAPEDGRPGIDHHVVLDNRVTRMALLQLAVLVRRETLGTQGHRLVDPYPFADDRGFA